MSAININKNNFQNEVLNSDKPILLDLEDCTAGFQGRDLRMRF